MMSSTHDVICRKCGKNIAWWSQWDNIQYRDEYECQGKVWQKYEHWHFGKTQSNAEPTPEYVIECYGKPLKVKRHSKELWHCSIVNNTQYCEECAKELKYRCPKCGGEIKLTRKSR